MPSLGTRIQNAWNILLNKENLEASYPPPTGMAYYSRPDRPRLTRGNERSIVTSVYNRIALDCAATTIQHVRMDENGRFKEEIKDGLDYCLTVSANTDQTSRAFLHDAVLSMLDEGVVAIVPTYTDDDPRHTNYNRFGIQEMRCGKVKEWWPDRVRIELYNDVTGRHTDVTLPKSFVAIVENPFYSVMNEPNSTMQRLIRKLTLLDVIDEQNGAGKLDLIIQLPYTLKTDTKRAQAEARRKDIEMQLSGSKYGIAYTDATEHITQLNRSVDNQLIEQIKYLQELLYSQLGMTVEIMNGTAESEAMTNYYTRLIEPIISAFIDEMKRKFLTKTARTQGQDIFYYRDPFKLVPIDQLAEIADKFTRNEIMSPNEIRQIVGRKPVDDPNADALRNRNINMGDQQQFANANNDTPVEGEEDYDAESYARNLADVNALDAELDALEDELMQSDEDVENDILEHYASPYYDPVKAHEYYEAHKKLKGRKTTSNLNEEGRNIASYVKEQINKERDSKIDAHRSQTDSQIESAQSERDRKVEQHKNEMNSAIEALRNQLKRMSPAHKRAHRDEIQADINALREENAEMRAELSAEFKQTKVDLNAGHKTEKANLTAEYEEKYLQELDKLHADPKYKKVAKTKKKSSKKSSGKTKSSSSIRQKYEAWQKKLASGQVKHA